MNGTFRGSSSPQPLFKLSSLRNMVAQNILRPGLFELLCLASCIEKYEAINHDCEMWKEESMILTIH